MRFYEVLKNAQFLLIFWQNAEEKRIAITYEFFWFSLELKFNKL